MELWYPAAEKRPLGPQTEPMLVDGGRPRVLIFHTMVGHLGGTDAMFKRDGYTGTESHFGVGGPWEDRDGVVYQWQSLDRQADAQWAGNAYATSIETADGGNPENPWSDKQLAALIDLTVWWCEQVDAPAVMVHATTERGIGYHQLFHEWNQTNHACPGPIRFAQLRDIVLPGARAKLVRGPVPAPPATPSPTRRPVLKRWIYYRPGRDLMTGPDVDMVVRRLGLMRADQSDAAFGPRCDAAVRRVQEARRIRPVDGVIGKATAPALGFDWAGPK